MAYAAVIDGVGVVVEVNAETDFVAKNDLFVDLCQGRRRRRRQGEPGRSRRAVWPALTATARPCSRSSNEKVLVIGENIKVRRFARYDNGLNVPYVHAGGTHRRARQPRDRVRTDAAVVELGKDIAMQIAALNPDLHGTRATSPRSSSPRRRRSAWLRPEEDPKNAKKPDAIIEKIVMGGIAKYFKEICLLQQPFVKDDKVSVEDHIAAVAKQVGASIKLVGYTRFEKGEGIEKRQDDLAEEVAKLVK